MPLEQYKIKQKCEGYRSGKLHTHECEFDSGHQGEHVCKHCGATWIWNEDENLGSL